MATLDVTDAILTADFLDSVIVVRRTETVNNFGESVVSSQRFTAFAVVAATSPDDLVRSTDEELMHRTISVVTKFPIRGPAPGFQPDLVLWQGDQFVITKIAPYSNFGPGFIEAEATSMDTIDEPPLPYQPGIGELLFYAPVDSGLITVI